MICIMCSFFRIPLALLSVNSRGSLRRDSLFRKPAGRSVCFVIVLLLCLTIPLLSGGCGKRLLDPARPLTLTMWHNYGGQMKILMDEMIDEFNASIGASQGIIVNVTAISGSQELHEMLVAAAKETPGAMPLPDMTTAYPKTAAILRQYGRLVDLKKFFTDEKLAGYVAPFVEEGMLDSDQLYVFPIAKSTEVLFVNQTLFDRFAAENDVDLDDLATFEGIAAVSLKYLEWTDSKTPGIRGDGKAFFMADSLFNQALVGSRQLDEQFLVSGLSAPQGDTTGLNLDGPAYDRIWDAYYTAAACGSIAVFDGYSSDLFKTGDLVCSVGSTAGVLFYPEKVTYPDNTQDKADFTVLPYPVYQDGLKIALQRGSGLCVLNPDDAHAYAASIFLDWFTQPEQNLRFTLSSGYLPVTKEAFNRLWTITAPGTQTASAVQLENPRIARQLETVLHMYDQYDFFYAPPDLSSEDLERRYEEQLMAQILAVRQKIAAKFSQDTFFAADAVELAGIDAAEARQQLIERMK